MLFYLILNHFLLLQHLHFLNAIMNSTPSMAPDWQQAVFNVLKEGGVHQIAYVPPRMLPPRDGPYIKNRFRAALGLRPF